jgi:hypothetical protein
LGDHHSGFGGRRCPGLLVGDGAAIIRLSPDWR